MNPRSFFSELKRRNVYKVAIAYGVVAWLLIQIATQTFPFFDVPNWVVRAVILVLLVGFPIALVFAWVFELTPEGLKRTEEVPAKESIVRQTGRKLDAVIIVVLLCVIGILLFQRFHRSNASSGWMDKGIAVLPFDNFSDDKENAFFADGIQDDILTSLAKIRGLTVISRASVMPYRGASKNNLRQIAEALGVANVLEGSVRGGKDRIVVSVQLIDARNNHHIWANRYDRPLADSLGLQGELATEIAKELRATLSPEEKMRVEAKPTNNPDAYVLYLRARVHESNPEKRLEDLELAAQLYRETIQLDPTFALAHARLSATLARIYHWFDPTDGRKALMRTEAEKALQLQPDLPEGHVSLALYYYWGESNYEKALEEFAVASKALPNDSEIFYLTAAIRRRQGRWKDNLELLQKDLAINPGDAANITAEIAYTYIFLHDWAQAAQTYDRVVALAPDSPNFKINRAYVDLYASGKTDRLRATLAKIPSGVDPSGLVTRARWDLAMLERDYAAADRALDSYTPDIFQVDGMQMPKSFFRGCTALARTDEGPAKAQFMNALPTFEAAARDAPTASLRHANLGLLYSFMGRKEDAIREGRRAVELEPESKDMIWGPWMQGFLAMIYVRTGEFDSALPILERLLTAPFPVDNTNCCITYNDLRKRWQWDPIRNDPRFQKLVASEASPAASPQTR
jgi:TolB-like protein/Tfp pilus assembly protein PilF